MCDGLLAGQVPGQLVGDGRRRDDPYMQHGGSPFARSAIMTSQVRQPAALRCRVSARREVPDRPAVEGGRFPPVMATEHLGFKTIGPTPGGPVCVTCQRHNPDT